MAPDPRAIEKIADKLLKAEHPMLLAEYAGRRPNGFNNIVELAETTGSAVWDVNNALNFPNKHPLCLSMDKASLKQTDLVLGLDLKDWEKQLTELNSMTRQLEPLVAPNCDYVEIGFAEVGISKWAMDYCRMQPCSVRALGDTEIGIPELIRICKDRISKDGALKKKIEDRKVRIGKRHDEVWAKWQQDARKNWDASPITFQRLASEIWEVIKDEDWVLTANNLKQEVRKIWNFDKPYRHPGVELGTSTQIGISLGVAIACKEKGRLAVNINPDGDLMFDCWRALDRGQVPDPDADRDAQQPRLLQRLGAPDPHGEAARHRRGQGAYRHGPVRSGARLRHARAVHGLLRRRPDRQAGRRAAGAAPRARGGEEGTARRWWIQSPSTGDQAARCSPGGGAQRSPGTLCPPGTNPGLRFAPPGLRLQARDAT